VSNITTDFIRIYAWQGYEIGSAEAEWIVEELLSDAGSYWVPVTVRLADDHGYVDIQYGGGKGAGIGDFYDRYVDQYDAMWGRVNDPAWDTDRIWLGDPNREWPYRTCRYGFDELCVTTVDGHGDDLPDVPGEQWHRHDDGTWRISVTGIYHTSNSRTDLDHNRVGPGARLSKRAWDVSWPVLRSGGLATPTTPAFDGSSMHLVQPVQLRPLLANRWPEPPPGIHQLEFRWRGRLVHRVRSEDGEIHGRPTWQHRSADDWDNCVDPAFVEFHAGRPSPA
jgi:hypothetical protein